MLSDLFMLRGVPEHVRSDNGPELVAKAVLRDELLDGEIFYTHAEAKIVIESWRRHFNAREVAGG